MDKNAIKKFAIWARNELIARVTQKAEQYEITKKEITHADADSIGGRVLTQSEKKQRQALIAKINQDGFEQVMEEVAYTWFNRFTALRFMEVNNYLPNHTRVFTNENGEFKPQILVDAIQLDLDGLNMDKVYELKDANKNEELFKYLLVTQCNALSRILPGMFQKISDYTELLLPDYLLREGSVIERMVNQKNGIPEADWTDQVQIIGWLYQYYNTEPKDKVFAALKKNIRITKETIPAATQIFTPDWIVHYMVENSLGRLWLEGHPNNSLRSEWKYYLDEADQEADVQKQLKEIREKYAALKPEEIKCIDPCMGSGHILCVLFDTLVRIYEDYGYTAREAAASIVENNLWGLDIDERAAQLSYFAIMMKARKYDRRFFSRGIQPHVYAIEESNNLRYEGDYGDFQIDKEQQKTLNYLFDVFKDAKEYGSILNVEKRDYESLLNTWNKIAEQSLTDLRMFGWYSLAGEKVLHLANQAKALSQKYDVVITNPPYMGIRNMDSKLSGYLTVNYPISKYDLFSVFIQKCMQMTKRNSFYSLITQNSWMFINSFEKLRNEILSTSCLSNMNHLGFGAFGADFGTTAFVCCKFKNDSYVGTYIRLGDFRNIEDKEREYFNNENEYHASQRIYYEIPRNPFAYWISNQALRAFKEGEALGKVSTPRQGMASSDNKRFVRFWPEVSFKNIGFNCSNADESVASGAKWFPYNNGGDFRKWYGNNYDLVNWENDGYEVKEYAASLYKSYTRTIKSISCYFLPGGTWNAITSTSALSVRYFGKGFIFSNAGMAVFSQSEKYPIYYIIGFLNSKIAGLYLKYMSPTLNFNQGDIALLPIITGRKDEICRVSKECVDISKTEWDSFEISWDFQVHPLVPMVYKRQEQLSARMNSSERKKTITLLSERYKYWAQDCEYRFSELKKNEEELNRIFIEIYGLQEEITPEVDVKDVTVRKADLQRDIRSLISYAVGCMFGRYSLDMPGLAFAGGSWNESIYSTFRPHKDAIIPICDDEYFEDDIVGSFVKFIEVAYSKETLEENLQFIAQALSGKGTSREVIRNYFINGFYADHVKVYQKRPIYWLFDSGKKNGFKCLVYMHRYQPDTIARIRTDYVHEQQSRYRTAIADLEQRINGASTSERVKLNKQLSTLHQQADEIRVYEEKIHHLADQMIQIDLDDGVKKNYEIFKDVLAKIK